MVKPDVLEQLAVKGVDINAVADQLIEDRKQIPRLVEALQTERSSKKFAFEKALRLVSQNQPGLIYPFFDVFADLLVGENSILKWGAIITIGHLTVVDKKKKFEKFVRRQLKNTRKSVAGKAARFIHKYE